MSTAHDMASALCNRLAAISGLPPVAWPNVSFDPGETMWVRPTVLPTNAETASMGGPTVWVRYRGIFQVDVFAPAGTGTDAALAMADKIADAFLPGVALVTSSATVRVLVTWIERAISEPLWYMVPIRISYEALAALDTTA